MSYNIANMEDVGLYTVGQLSERTGVAKATLEAWVRRQWLPVVKIDGVRRTTVHMVKLAAEEAAKTGRGHPRSWVLEPADCDERIVELVEA